MKTIHCNICKENNTKLVLTTTDKRIRKDKQVIFSLVQCKNCGLVYINPQPTYEELKPFYGEDYFSSSYQHKGRKGEIYNFLKKIKKYFFDKIFYSQNPKFYKWKVLNNGKNGRFLDIGCATGLQDIKFMRDFSNWEFYGVEPDEVAFQEASKIKGFNVQKGLLEDANYPDKFFDVILMNQVLEHVSDPKKTLLECNRIIKDDGKLIVAVPNYDSLSSKIFGKYWYHLDIPRHLYHFTPQTLKKLFQNTRFSVDKIEGEFLSHSWWGSLMILLNINRKLFISKIFIYFFELIFIYLFKLVYIKDNKKLNLDGMNAVLSKNY